MAYEQKEGDFALFPNDRKTSDRQPDWKGTIVINGVKMELAAWNKPGRNGEFLAGKCQPMRERQQPRGAPKRDDDPPHDYSDKIPF